MGLHRPRHGSMQFWPRKKARKEIPSVNWNPLENKNLGSKGILGTIGYKAGMISVVVKDSTPNSMTKGKQITIPATIIECPPVKILGLRFYKNGITALDILSDNLDKELKKKIKLPKVSQKDKLEKIKLEDYDTLRLLIYSVPKSSKIKKVPDIVEVGIEGDMVTKLETAKKLLGKEINIGEVFDKGKLLDIRAVTKGKGFTGPIKRMGLHLKPHKTEKGLRRPGSLGPWHPAHVTYRAHQAGQFGYFTRVKLNNKIIDINSKENVQDIVIDNYGKINSNYLLVKGSVAGPLRRAVFLTYPLRPTKHTSKEVFEVVELHK